MVGGSISPGQIRKHGLYLHHYNHFISRFHPNGGFNGIVHGPPVLYPANSMFVQGASYGLNDMPKPRGTETYLPNMQNRPLHNYRAPSVGGRIVDGSVPQPNGVVNVGPFPHFPPGSHFHSSSNFQDPLLHSRKVPTMYFLLQSQKSPEAVIGRDDARSITPSPYHLKDEVDFPPLST